MSTSAATDYVPVKTSAGPLAIGGWMLFDWSAQPYYTLVTTFLFAPYFSAYFIGDAASGTALWGYTMAAAAVVIAFGGPLIGAFADARGRLKPIIFILSIGFVISQFMLWYAVPGAAANIWIIVLALIVATVCIEFAEILYNALMPRLVTPDQLGRLSGAGWALGYVGGLASLIVMVAFVLIDTGTGLTMLGLEPLLPLDVATREMDRIVGPFCAVWFMLFVIPFFLFTPDAPARAGAEKVSLGGAVASVLETLRKIRAYRDIALFFAARMLYIDGLLAIFTFGGIYAATEFGWQTIVIGYFGIILSLAAGIGAAVGGVLDDKLGSKRVIIGAILTLMIGLTGAMSIDRDSVLFFIAVTPPEPNGAAFASTGEMVYIVFSILIGLAAGPLQAASRSLLARMAPPEHMTEFFGFFAFSGKVTAFAAPFIIGLVASFTGSLQVALSVILLFLVSGLVLISLVNVGRAEG